MSFYMTITNIKSQTKYALVTLNQSINLLEKQWEIALTEAFFPSKLPLIYSGERICKIYSGHAIHTFRATNNMYFDNVSKLVAYLQKQFFSTNEMNIAYIDNKIIIKSKHPKAWVYFDTKIAYVLGVAAKTKIQNDISYSTDISGGIYNIYLYTDIIEPQYVGNVRAPLLKTIAIDRSSANTHVIYENPYYLTIPPTQLMTICLDARTLTGEQLKFPKYSYIYFTLHFRIKTINNTATNI